jgi:hypothetical protein
MMVRANLAEPPTQGAADHGANVEGALQVALGASFVELLVLLALMVPWSPNRSGGGLLLAWGVFAPWLMITALMSLHGGSVILLHLLWVLVLVGALTVWTAAHLIDPARRDAA